MLLGRFPQAVLQRLLELLQHRFLDHDVLVIQVVDDVLVAALGVDVDNDGLDRRVALDEDTCKAGGLDSRWLRSFESGGGDGRTAVMLTSDGSCWHGVESARVTRVSVVFSLLRYPRVLARPASEVGCASCDDAEIGSVQI